MSFHSRETSGIQMIISGFDDFTVFGSFSILSFILELFSFPDIGSFKALVVLLYQDL